MKKLIFILTLLLPFSLAAQTCQIGPSAAYMNIGDYPWGSTAPGTTISICTKTNIVAVTASASAGTTMTLTTSAGSIPYGSTVWFAGFGGNILIPTTCGIYGSGLYGNPTGGTACSGSTVTLLAPVSVGAGVTVYFQPPYYEKLNLAIFGTAALPITVQGVPDPTTGALPVLDSHNATTGTNMPTYGLFQYHRGLGMIFLGKTVAGSNWAQYLTLSHLRVQSYYAGAVIYDSDNTAHTNISSSYGIYMQNAEHIALSGNEVVNNNGGFFGAENGTDDCNYCNYINYITFSGNHFYYNGQVADVHQSYVEGYMITYDGNWYDSPNAGGSSQLKDRSTGTVIRYNRFEPDSRELDLVDAQNSFQTLVQQTDLVVPTGGFAANATTLTVTPFTTTGTTTAGSNQITSVASIAGIWSAVSPDVCITGTGIPANTVIKQTYTGLLFLSNQATASNAGVTLTMGGVCGINVGDYVGYENNTVGWGYPGSGNPVMPSVASVDTSTNTLTLNSPGIPASLAAGAVLYVLSQQLYPYKQTFVYGNIFDLNQKLLNALQGPVVHYGWDTAGGLDSVQDRAGTAYVFDNTLIVQWDLSGSAGSAYGFSLFQPESNNDVFELDNNDIYVSNAPGSSNPSTYLRVVKQGGYNSTGLASGTFGGGNNQIVTSTSIGSNTACGLTFTGIQACYSYPGGNALNPGASINLANWALESKTALYPGGVGSFPYILQTGSSAIGAASTLPAAIASNTLGSDFTPYQNFGGTTRANLNDLGAIAYYTPYYTLSTSTTGTGTGTVSGCAGSYLAGASYSCTATPSGSSTFVSWTSTCGGTAAADTYSGTMPSSLCNVTASFSNGVTLSTISIAPTSGVVSVGGTQTFTPTCTYSGASPDNCSLAGGVTWLSSDATKASINSSGVAVGVAAGSANIAATTSGLTSNTVPVTVTSGTPSSIWVGTGPCTQGCVIQ